MQADPHPPPKNEEITLTSSPTAATIGAAGPVKAATELIPFPTASPAAVPTPKRFCTHGAQDWRKYITRPPCMMARGGADSVWRCVYILDLNPFCLFVGDSAIAPNVGKEFVGFKLLKLFTLR